MTEVCRAHVQVWCREWCFVNHVPAAVILNLWAARCNLHHGSLVWSRRCESAVDALDHHALQINVCAGVGVGLADSRGNRVAHRSHYAIPGLVSNCGRRGSVRAVG